MLFRSKFLRAGGNGDRELTGRFTKEAEAAAALDHPNITTIYEIGEADGHAFIAMVLVEGESLAAKIKRRPLPLDEALNIAIQAAEALQAAHERGVVHRDIKPGNIMLTADGRVKVMDFGLAHLTGQTRMTKTGTVMGTPAYMSPEQARGEEVDHRSDIWSLGVVLYEMVAGRLPFPGESGQIVALAIQNDEPEPLTAVRAGLPMELERIVGKALAKEPDARYQHADELVVDLRSLVGLPKSGGQSESARTRFRRRDLVSGLLAACLAIALFVAVYFRPDPAVDRPVSKWSFTPDALTATLRNVVVSPNGRHIAYRAGPGEPRLWVRDLNSFEPRTLLGTEGANHGFFWSPDSRFLGFAANTVLKKISLDGGPPITLCKVPTGFGAGSWSSDGETIAFGAKTRIYEVSSTGGEPKLLFEPVETDKGRGNWYPQFLPSQARTRSVVLIAGDGDNNDVVLKNLETGQWRVLVENGGFAFYSPSGHIVFSKPDGSQWNLWALPFALDTLQPRGEPFPIAGNANLPSVSEDGTLVFVGSSGWKLEQLIWCDREGKTLGEIGQAQPRIQSPALSPDGSQVAVQALDGNNSDVWVHEVQRPGKRRLTFHATPELTPVWSPSGRTIAFSSWRNGTLNIFQKAADGAGETELLLDTPTNDRPRDWSHDGNFLFCTVQSDNFDIFYLQRKNDGTGYESLPFLQTPANERSPRLSPDGKFVAYCSDESGKSQVWVRPFPSGEGLWQVSSAGGCQPRWSRDGKELFYVDGATLMAVTIATSPVFRPGSAKPLFSNSHLARIGQTAYDVSADGRFVLVEDARGEDAKPPSIHVVENWYEEFRGRR